MTLLSLEADSPCTISFLTGTQLYIGKVQSTLNEYENILKCDRHSISCTQPYSSSSCSFVPEAAAAASSQAEQQHPPLSPLVSCTISKLHHRRQSSSRHRQLLKLEKEPSSEKGTLSCLLDIFICNSLLSSALFYP